MRTNQNRRGRALASWARRCIIAATVVLLSGLAASLPGIGGAGQRVAAQSKPAPGIVVNLGHVEVRSLPADFVPPPPLMIAPDAPPPPNVVRSRPVSLEEARALAGFAVALPTWLPTADYQLDQVQVLEVPDRVTVILVYRDATVMPSVEPNREVVISQQRWAGMGPISVFGMLEEGVIGGRPAAFWSQGLPIGSLNAPQVVRQYAFWELGELLVNFNVTGISRADLIRIAESMTVEP